MSNAPLTEPSRSSSKFRRASAAAFSTTLVAATLTGVVALAPAHAASVSLTGTAWTPQSVGGSVMPTQVGILAAGGGGGTCSEGWGGTGGVVAGALTVQPTDAVTAILGTKGGACTGTGGTVGGAAGIGAYPGGKGGNSTTMVSPGSGASSYGGGGGGGSTSVSVNGTEVSVAGGGGGHGGDVYVNVSGDHFGTGGTAGNGGGNANNGDPGTADGSGAAGGAGGLSTNNAKTPGTDGDSASCDTSIGSCGGGGGAGGGSGNQTAAGAGTAGSASPTASGGGGGAGGATWASLTDPSFNTASSPTNGSAQLTYLDITAGTVSDVDKSTDSSFSGTAFTSDETTELAWSLLGTSGTDYPAGLTIDASTGAVSGSTTSADPGTYQFEVQGSATYDFGGAGSVTLTSVKSITMHVTAAPTSPTVTGMTPTQGPVAGGTQITITGTNLTGAAVSVGGAACTDVVVASDGNSLTCNTPAHSTAENVQVNVTTGNGTVEVPGGFTYIGIMPPYKPTETKVKGGPFAKKFVISWNAPHDPGDRPVIAYRLLLNQRGFKHLIIKKKLPSSQESFSISRKKLLKNSVLTRGDVRDAVAYRVRVQALNSAGVGSVSTRHFGLILR